MTEEPPKKDANDVLREGGTLAVTGEPIDPGAVVVSMDRYRKRSRASSGDEKPPAGPASGQSPPPDDIPHPADGSDGGNDGERPKIVVSTNEHEVNRAAVAALARIPNVYQRGTALMRVLAGRNGREGREAPVIEPIPKEVLQEHLAEAAQFVKMQPSQKKGEDWDEIPQHPPRWCVGNLNARGDWPGVPVLSGVVETPILRRDGSVLGRPGYDPLSGVILQPRFEPMLPSERPTADEVQAALVELAEVVCDVMFAHPAHRSVWLASVLTPLARQAFDGPAPLFLFEASIHGAGKGLLVWCAVRIATGRAPSMSPYTEDDDEMKKQIVTWGSTGRNVVVIDEVEGRLDGKALRSALTGEQLEGRLLGASRDWRGPNLITWYATGNNVSKGREMYRRIAPIQIHARDEDPSRRGDWKNPDLKAYVGRRQRELTCAALTLLRGYCAAGMPDQKLPAWGSFESWSALVRGAIVWAGWPDPAIAAFELREEDGKQKAYRALAGQWARMLSLMNRPAVTVKDAFAFITRDPAPLPELASVLEEIATDKDGKPNARALGYVMRRLNGAVFVTDQGNVKISSSPDRVGTQQWSVVRVGAGDAGDAGDVSSPTHERSPDGNIQGVDLSPASPASPATGDLFSRGEEEKKDPKDEWGWSDD